MYQTHSSKINKELNICTKPIAAKSTQNSIMYQTHSSKLITELNICTCQQTHSSKINTELNKIKIKKSNNNPNI